MSVHSARRGACYTNGREENAFGRGHASAADSDIGIHYFIQQGHACIDSCIKRMLMSVLEMSFKPFSHARISVGERAPNGTPDSNRLNTVLLL